MINVRVGVWVGGWWVCECVFMGGGYGYRLSQGVPIRAFAAGSTLSCYLWILDYFIQCIAGINEIPTRAIYMSKNSRQDVMIQFFAYLNSLSHNFFCTFHNSFEQHLIRIHISIYISCCSTLKHPKRKIIKSLISSLKDICRLVRINSRGHIILWSFHCSCHCFICIRAIQLQTRTLHVIVVVAKYANNCHYP